MKQIEFKIRTETDQEHTICIEPERVLCNDVVLPWESHPHRMRLWIVCNEYGALGAVWANHEQDALDELVDKGLGDGLLIKEEDADEETPRLGNADEPACLDHVRLFAYPFDKTRDCELLCRFAEARGAGADNLDK